MIEVTEVSRAAVDARKKVASQFVRKGVMISLFSAFSYGIYSAMLAVAMTKGVWGDWYGTNTAGLSTFVIVYLIGLIGCGINDTCSAIWALVMAGFRGKLGDYFRCLNSTPGRIIMLAGIMGGPIANSAYVIGLQSAGSIIVPIAALSPAVGAILGRVLYKQKLNARMLVGIAICFSASAMIGFTGLSVGSEKGMVVGIIAALVAAIGWGIEGCIAGYGSAMVDSEISIAIRQSTSGIANLVIFVPILGMLAGNVGLSLHLTGQAFTSGSAMIWFAVSGFIAYISYMAWYRGVSMNGAALGMACTGTFSFFAPFSCWIILGVIIGKDGWSITPIAWVSALLMALGILIIAMNPLDLFRKKEVGYNEAA